MPSDPIIATVGTPTPTPKRPTLYGVAFEDDGVWDCEGLDTRLVDAEQMLCDIGAPGAVVFTIPGETDAAPRPTGDVLAAADALASAAENLIVRLGRCHTRQMGAGGQTTEACLARTAYVNVPVTIDAELAEALAEWRRLAARNATTKQETDDPTPTL